MADNKVDKHRKITFMICLGERWIEVERSYSNQFTGLEMERASDATWMPNVEIEYDTNGKDNHKDACDALRKYINDKYNRDDYLIYYWSQYPDPSAYSMKCTVCNKNWNNEELTKSGGFCPECLRKKREQDERETIEKRVKESFANKDVAFEGVEKLTKKEYDSILRNWLRGNWRDEMAYDMVGQLLKEVWRLWDERG